MDHITDPAIDRTIAGQSDVQTLYTAVQIAERLEVSEATIRNRWFEWIEKVVPEPLLKQSKNQYTQLALELFSKFSTVERCDRNQWVIDTKAHYAQEWASAGVIEGELMPEEVGNVLALRQSQTTELELAVAQQLQSLESLIDQANTAESNLSEADVKAAVTRGQQRAVMLYQAELQAELQTMNALKQRRMQGGQQ